MFEIERNFHAKAQVIRNAKRTERRKRMPIVQVKMDGLPYGADCLDQIESDRTARGNGSIDRRHQLRKMSRLRLESADIAIVMGLCVRGASRAYANVANVDARADSLQVGDL